MIYWSASSSSVTYIATSRNMFDIVFGATARGDVAEVQLFVHYLNLKTGRQIHRQASKEERKKENKKERKKGVIGRQEQRKRADQPQVDRKQE